jgi:hypothetical protein
MSKRDFRWTSVSRTMLVEVYHSGTDEKRITAPFAIVTSRTHLPKHPEVNSKDRWAYWKQVPLNAIVVDVSLALKSLAEEGFYIQ